jgi:hypothetical protein
VLTRDFTHHTTGYYANEALERDLDDARNAVGADGDPWAWGFASVNFDDWAGDLAGDRLAALRSYFTAHPDRFIGIKLAHAHQQVPFTDPAYQGVYQVAAEVGVPVLLHTGFSPFPGAQSDPAYYDPLWPPRRWWPRSTAPTARRVSTSCCRTSGRATPAPWPTR